MFSSQRLQDLDQEQAFLDQAIRACSSEFAELIQKDIDWLREREGDFVPDEMLVEHPAYPYVENTDYALYGNWSRTEKNIYWHEGRHDDQFSLPLSFLFDPESWTLEYQTKREEFSAWFQLEKKRIEEQETLQTEALEKQQYHKLHAKYGPTQGELNAT